MKTQSNIDQIIKLIESKKNLDKDQSFILFDAIINGNLEHDKIERSLIGLQAKEESSTEIAIAADVLRKASSRISYSDSILDTCGTGGDGLFTPNVSTLSSLICATSGVRVAKHGNQSVSSKSGSSNLVQALGVYMPKSEDDVRSQLNVRGYVYLHAPFFHPAMKRLAPIRKKIGKRTIFNCLGPLCNPMPTTFQVVGVYKDSLLVPIAEAFKQIGLKKAYIVHGDDGMDEISLCGETRIAKLANGSIQQVVTHPSEWGMDQVRPEDVQCPSAESALLSAQRILNGETGAKTDLVVLNAAFALELAGKVESVVDGVLMARELLESGRVKEFVRSLRNNSTSCEKENS